MPKVATMKNLKITSSSGNIFQDLNLENHEELALKSNLIIALIKIIKSKKLTQSEAAQVLGVDQPKISALLKGKIDGFSVERLLRFLNSFNQDLQLLITESPNNCQGTVKVLMAV